MSNGQEMQLALDTVLKDYGARPSVVLVAEEENTIFSHILKHFRPGLRWLPTLLRIPQKVSMVFHSLPFLHFLGVLW